MLSGDLCLIKMPLIIQTTRFPLQIITFMKEKQLENIYCSSVCLECMLNNIRRALHIFYDVGHYLNTHTPLLTDKMKAKQWGCLFCTIYKLSLRITGYIRSKNG